MNVDREWQSQIRIRLNREADYKIWKEWLELVWRLPTTDELKIREDEVDYDCLPFEYCKVYSK